MKKTKVINSDISRVIAQVLVMQACQCLGLQKKLI